MTWIFWLSVLAIGYTYIGYPAILYVWARWRKNRVEAGPFLPRVSVVIAVRNGAAWVDRKLHNLSQINYPADRLEILVLSDGSTDDTNGILSRSTGTPPPRVFLNPRSRGKAACLNDAISDVNGDIVVFMDVRQQVESDAVRVLVENFADPRVGCASGELMLGDPPEVESVGGVGLYWKIEKKIREWESASESVIGATGALYAVRRSLLVPLPQGTILDDVYIPIHVLRQGFRVVFDKRARAWDEPDLGIRREFARKVRTLSGNYQLLHLEPWLLTGKNPLRFQFVSHKLMRLFVPFALLTLLVASSLAHGIIYRAALVLQLAFYALSALVVVPHFRVRILQRVSSAAFGFLLLNAAAAVAFAKFVTAREVEWGN